MTTWRFTARPQPPLATRFALALLSLILSLFLGALLLALAGLDPLAVYVAMLRASLLGGPYALADTAIKATPLILAGLGCALAFRAGLWNVGAEGQLLLGAWVATGVGAIWWPSAAAWVLLPTMAALAMLVGGLYAGLAGWLKARFGVSEILVSLMLVYVAELFNKFWIFGPWSQGGFPLTPMLAKAARLPKLSDASVCCGCFSGLTVHLGFGLALVLAGLLWWWLKRSRFGLHVEVLGANPQLARVLGVDVTRLSICVMFASGTLAGLAGMVGLSGVVYRLQERLSPGYGFSAIIVAWLARLNPLAVIPAAILLGALLVGSREVQPAGIALLLQGLLLFVWVASQFFQRYRLQPSGSKNNGADNA